MDALPLVGTAGSVSAIYQIYQAQEISRDELDSWLIALAFHKKPSLDLIRTLNVSSKYFINLQKYQFLDCYYSKLKRVSV